jgi:hypothetical protein
MLLMMMLAISLTARQAMSATVCGVAQDARGVPVAGVSIIARDSSGKVLGQITTGRKGEYQLDNLGQGILDLFLDPGSTGVQGGSGVLSLSGASQMINWQVSDASRAAASPGGPCLDPPGALTPEEWAAIGVLGLGAAAGTAATVWAETGNSHGHEKPVSSSF